MQWKLRPDVAAEAIERGAAGYLSKALTGARSVTANADLSFSTLETARQAPRVLADMALVETAVGLVMAAAGISADEAHQRLVDAARRAGLSEVQVAEAVVAAGGDHQSWPEM